MKTIIAILLLPATVLAQDETTRRATTLTPHSVSPGIQGETVSTIPTAGTVQRRGRGHVLVRIINSCFGTNLRSVTNPISPDGTINATLVLEAAGEQQTVTISYPGYLVIKNAADGDTPMALDASALPSGSRVSAFGNTVQLDLPVTFTASVSTDGTITKTTDRLKLLSSSFAQAMNSCTGPGARVRHATTYPCGQYMGKSGPLTASISPAVVAADNSAIEMTVAFPGQNGFCGGFYSPLMVFLDKKRPAFTGISDFPLNPGASTAWPEAGAPGHFIAFDKDGNGKIDAKDELFGETIEYKNGFEALRVHDSNRDGVIDKKDANFRKLMLWSDANGDGISQKGEVVAIGEHLASVSLKYEKNLRPIGLSAEEREMSTGQTKTKKTVNISDIWLAPKSREPAQEKK